MKYLIVLLLCLTVFSQEITSTTQYEKIIDQAEAEYKAIVSKAKKVKDAKVLKAFKLYIVALEDAKKKAMKAGDLDRANKLNEEIVSLNEIFSKNPPKATEEHTEPVLGTWTWGGKTQNITFHKNGEITGNQGETGKWNKGLKGYTALIKSRGKSHDHAMHISKGMLLVTPEGKQMFQCKQINKLK